MTQLRTAFLFVRGTASKLWSPYWARTPLRSSYRFQQRASLRSFASGENGSSDQAAAAASSSAKSKRGEQQSDSGNGDTGTINGDSGDTGLVPVPIAADERRHPKTMEERGQQLAKSLERFKGVIDTLTSATNSEELQKSAEVFSKSIQDNFKAELERLRKSGISIYTESQQSATEAAAATEATAAAAPSPEETNVAKTEQEQQKLDQRIDEMNELLRETLDAATDFVNQSIGSLETFNEHIDSARRMFDTSRDFGSDFWDRTGAMVEERIRSGLLVDQIQATMDDADLFPDLLKPAHVRFGHCLPQAEVDYRKQRIHSKRACQAFAKFIGVPEHEVTPDNMPVIAFAGSGGGYRAMVSTVGFLDKMEKNGLWDCTMYAAGVSGSTWAMMLAYTFNLQNQGNSGLFNMVRNHLRGRLGKSPASLTHLHDVFADPQIASTAFEFPIWEYIRGRPLSFVTLYGSLLFSRLFTVPTEVATSSAAAAAEQLAGNAGQSHPLAALATNALMSQQLNLPSASMPIPIYASVHVDNRNRLWHWFEFTPFEAGTPDYGGGVWIPTFAFGRQFHEGTAVERAREMNLASLMGVFGSAMCASTAHVLEITKDSLPVMFRDKMTAALSEYYQAFSDHVVPPAFFPNPFYGLDIPALPPTAKTTTSLTTVSATTDGANGANGVDSAEKKMFEMDLVVSPDIRLCDAGLANNLPFPSLIRPERNVDVIIAFDSSADARERDWVAQAGRYAEDAGLSHRWPAGARSFNDPIDSASSERQYCRIIKDDVNRQAVSIVYIPLLGGQRHLSNLLEMPQLPQLESALKHTETTKEFDPVSALFMTTLNFEYTPDQVDDLTNFAGGLFESNQDKIRQLLKDIWERKRQNEPLYPYEL
ncbi:FabD/lysophospholipase-like protein [Ramicandelaber brevisporus]|nr:FabD/lysophospholipase-like protein [Ramicandelaber brevisporus]